MPTGIVINLDYEHHPQAACEKLWTEIRSRMLANGFRLSGRLFTHFGPPEAILPLARMLMETMEPDLEFHERNFHQYIKDFYGFRMEQVTDLLTPCARDIEVREMRSAAELAA